MGFKANSGRYAYDFCPVNWAGDLVGGDGDSEKDWYGYGVTVLAPGHGKVVAAENQMQDNILGQRDFDFEQAIEAPNSIMGNYVLVDHLNGEYSLLAHLKQGSLLVREGATVEQGQELGQIGFSGSTGPWVHLHYELRTGIDLRTARGLPAYFRYFSRFRGQKQTKIERGHIDTVDIIESDA